MKQNDVRADVGGAMRWKKLAHDALDQEGEQPILWPDDTAGARSHLRKQCYVAAKRPGNPD